MQRYTGRLASLVFGVVRRKDTVEGALRLHKLCVGGACFSVILDMRFSCLRSVVHCVFMVTTGYVCVMSSRLVFSCFMMFSGFLVVSGRVLVMLCCFMMVRCCFL
jgi:hypothetical protein